ncbi:Hsp70 family protein [Catellatospora sp. NPDC049609]|uniref:Hsp70 family protein n=1 Tax=Catellatospora sp. NPDC049609 TaxID=3155505 RepID=UPI003428648F
MSGPVYLSFSREHDAVQVSRLAGHLAAAGIYTVYDLQPLSDSRWEYFTRQRLDSCAAVLLVMTPEAQRSPWVARELDRARELGRPVVAVLLRGEPFAGVDGYVPVAADGLPDPELAARLRAAIGVRDEPPPRAQVAAWVPVRGGQTAHAVGIEVRGGLFVPVLPGGTAVPCERTEVFTTADDGQPSIKVTVFQGTGGVVAENQRIGAYELLLAPAPRGVPQVSVTFRVDERGRFTLLAHDADGRDVPVTLLPGGAAGGW